MTYQDIKSIITSSMSEYYVGRCKIMRNGKYFSGAYNLDGYVAMLYETLQEINSTDDYDPVGLNGVRGFIYAFNRLTGSHVPDVWT